MDYVPGNTLIHCSFQSYNSPKQILMAATERSGNRDLEAINTPHTWEVLGKTKKWLGDLHEWNYTLHLNAKTYQSPELWILLRENELTGWGVKRKFQRPTVNRSWFSFESEHTPNWGDGFSSHGEASVLLKNPKRLIKPLIQSRAQESLLCAFGPLPISYLLVLQIWPNLETGSLVPWNGYLWGGPSERAPFAPLSDNHKARFLTHRHSDSILPRRVKWIVEAMSENSLGRKFRWMIWRSHFPSNCPTLDFFMSWQKKKKIESKERVSTFGKNVNNTGCYVSEKKCQCPNRESWLLGAWIKSILNPSWP